MPMMIRSGLLTGIPLGPELWFRLSDLVVLEAGDTPASNK